MTILERPAAVNTKEPAPVIPPKQINSVVVDLNGRRQAFVTIEDAVVWLTRAWASEIRMIRAAEAILEEDISDEVACG